jgi:C4-dicarboxylate-specific signal transduction histidine kinase
MAGDKMPHQEKIKRSLKNIQEQVTRGIDISGRLNRFAHSMDEAEADIELGDFLRHIEALLQRLSERSPGVIAERAGSFFRVADGHADTGRTEV